uniref:NADH dehydrogenase subunit 4 n=1 Tax=Cryptomonas gyropyrenoidosa TaxID=233257 RepID=UPI0027AA173C|nr:NADH dehydrogenase subunit 4 [Cryptomonas gyropyrenoidosa]WFQ82705.1 NADH dehydrogenase subunit 4 [Cryptomonas gyropyrenoidosa]
MLSLLILIPLISVLIILVLPNNQIVLSKQIALITSFIVFIGSLILWVLFDNSNPNFQFIEYISWIPFYNINFFLGVDGISLFFIILSSLLTWICLLNSWASITKYIKQYLICFLLMESCLIIVFSSLDILIFYIFFESILIPMFLIIGIWGSRTRKLKAAYQFFLYTLIGSLFMLLGIFYILFETGTTDFQILNTISFYEEKEIILWFAFFLSFSVKVPIIPVHIWLPEAHVEAPTAGSVILAGILLKMGTYGLLRFSLCLFPYASTYFAPFVFMLGSISVVYSSLTTLRQIDLKKIVAYSSVAHMAFVICGIFTFNTYGIEGSLLIMLSHGFISSGLFLCIGVLYDRYHSRLIKYFSGLVQVMPSFSTFFLIFSMSNLGFPGTSSFCGEFLSLTGCFHSNTTITFIISIGMVLSAGYSLWLCNRVLFGPLTATYLEHPLDITLKEFAILMPLVLCIIWMGVYPEIFLSSIHLSVSNVLQKI